MERLFLSLVYSFLRQQHISSIGFNQGLDEPNLESLNRVFGPLMVANRGVLCSVDLVPRDAASTDDVLQHVGMLLTELCPHIGIDHELDHPDKVRHPAAVEFHQSTHASSLAWPVKVCPS